MNYTGLVPFILLSSFNNVDIQITVNISEHYVVMFLYNDFSILSVAFIIDTVLIVFSIHTVLAGVLGNWVL